MLTGNEKIELIQGDDYRYEIRLTNEEYSAVNKITFTCKALDIEAQMEGNESTAMFSYVIPKSITKLCIPFETTYDITIDFIDGIRESQTGIPLIIHKKRNPVVG